MSERDALIHAVNSHPLNTTPRLLLADWCADNGEPQKAARLRRGFRGFGGVGGNFGGVGGNFGGVGGGGGFGGIGVGGIGCVGFGGIGGFGCGGGGGIGGFGIGGVGGVGGVGGGGGIKLFSHNPRGIVMPTPGDRVMAFVPRGGYGSGFAVFVGEVQAELARGYLLFPVWNIEQVNRNDRDDARWIELANGVAELRRLAKYSAPLALPIEVPDGCMFWGWVGELPK